MKAILVIDIGDNKAEDLTVDELILSHREKDDYYRHYSSVQLKTIPMKMVPLAKLNKSEDGFCRGYNACIDAILGETE